MNILNKSITPASGPSSARLMMAGVSKNYGATQALAEVALRVDAGEVHALIGENGAGKSTLMKILSGAERADHGTVTIDGVAFAPGNPAIARRRGVAMIYQELTIAPDLTVAENITLGHWPASAGIISARRRDQAATQALQRLGVSNLPLNLRAGDLTNAQQQLIEIARALVGQPRVLIFDEPTSSLTRSDIDHLFAVIRRLASDGVSILYISHFLEEVQAVCQRFTVLRDGSSVATGTVANTTVATLIRHMVGREVADLYPQVPHTRGEAVVTVTNLAGRSKPTHVDLTLHAGEIFGIFGLVGAGRTEMARCLFGLDRSTQGECRWRGQPLPHRSPPSMLRRGFGFLSENRKEEGLLLDQSIADNITITRLDQVSTLGWIHPQRQHHAAQHWMETLGIKAVGPDQAVGALSGGNQQKVALARLLNHDCRVFILDEPTRGVDIGAKATIYQRIGELAADGRTILVISSYIPELFGICDTIAAMCRGVLGPPMPTQEWTEQRLLAAAIGQDSA